MNDESGVTCIVHPGRKNQTRTECGAVIVLCSLLSLVDCGGGDNNATRGDSGNNGPGTPMPAPPPPPDQSVDHGRYVGTVTIDGVDYFGDALFAANGGTHLYIGGSYTADGKIQAASPDGSIDFVSPASTPSGHEVAGAIIGREGEDCGAGSPSLRWCNRGSSAQMSVERAPGSEVGAIQGVITDDDETWTFDLTPWSTAYNVPARLDGLAGQYTEEVAPFGSNMVLTIDEEGRAFFQAWSLCIGNGTFAPYGDGSFNVFDVQMSIANCDYPYSQYNGEYRGFATLSPSDYSGSDTNVRIWLVSYSPDWSAVTMWGRRIPGS